jgi:HD superfamily phosphodiesterase
LPQIEKQARNILQYSQAKFPYYTPHGFQHSENVLENLNWLLSEEVKTELNAYDLFFLIIAAWLHDWGLVGTPSEDSEKIRENHHLRTEEKFRHHYALVGVSNNEARIIGRLCKGHRKVDLSTDEFRDTPFEGGLIIHRRFLAASLRNS